MGKGYSLAIAMLVLSTCLIAESFEQHHRQEAHTHGLAEITLAIEGDEVDVELQSPAANIVGFEHIASTPEQRGLVDKASLILKSPNKLFSFFGTSCELKASEIDISDLLGDEVHGSEENGHDHLAHDKLGHETHSEVSANYQFYCEQGPKLTAITLNFLEYFSGIETLHIAWVTDNHQGSVELTDGSNTVYLREIP